MLATTRPDVYVVEEEAIKVEPWQIERGAALLRVAVDEDFYWAKWDSENLDLLTSPLTVLAAASRSRRCCVACPTVVGAGLYGRRYPS